MKELIILGRGPSWKECPFDAEIWATASVLLIPELRDKEYSKVFAFDEAWSEACYTHLPIARERGIPVCSTRIYATEPYPLQEIIKEFKTNFLKNTVSYIIAYAIYSGYEKLRLYGIDQGPDWAYMASKFYVTFWLGVAIGRGVQYKLASTSILEDAQMEHNCQMIEKLKKGKEWGKIAAFRDNPRIVER